MKKILIALMSLILLSGCAGAKETAACKLVGGNNTATITEGRDISSDKDGKIIAFKQTIQIDSTEPDVLLIYKEYYEKQLVKFAPTSEEDKTKTSITETETGLMVTIEFDVKHISDANKTRMMEILESEKLDAESVLTQMKEAGFKCGEEEEPTEDPETEENKEEAKS